MFNVYYKFEGKWYLSDKYNQAQNALNKYDKLKRDFIGAKITLDGEDEKEHCVVWTNGATTIKEVDKISG